jgi:GST-like protein
MIDLYYWTTPNGHKITLFLEETNTPYTIKPIKIGNGEQFEPDFLAISPNNKIPAIVDHSPLDSSQPIAIFESGAILLYLAEKYKQLLPCDLHGKYDVLQWLFWQVAGLGPMLGQNHHFVQYAQEKIPYAINRYVQETSRLYAVLDKQLATREYIADSYSIADIACYPWIVPYENQQQNLDNFPNLKRWFLQIQARPAVKRAYALAENINTNSALTDDAKKILFGQDASTIKQKK